MKKFYTLAAMAAVSAAAFAVNPALQLQPMEQIQSVQDLQGLEYRVNDAEGPLRAPATPPMGTAIYINQGYSQVEGGGMEYGSVQLVINGTEAEFIGMLKFDAAIIKGEYDPATMSVKFPAQPTIYTGEGGAQIWAYPVKQTVKGEGETAEVVKSDMPYMVYTYRPNGVKLTDQNGKETVAYVGAFLPDDFRDQWAFNTEGQSLANRGYGWYYNNAFRQLTDAVDLDWFEYDAAEWADGGIAKLDEGWMSPAFANQNMVYDVPFKVNKQNSKVYLLMDPYGKGTPFEEINKSTTPGYIYLDCTDPNCVLVRPFTYTGLSCGVYSDVDWDYMQFATNKEAGMYYIDQYSTEDIIDEFEGFDDEISKKVGNVITIPTCRIQWSTDILNPTAWEFESGVYYGESAVTLDFAGVEDMISDQDNAASRYFNLQGVEIASPEAGQVVIVKKGNKTSKVVR